MRNFIQAGHNIDITAPTGGISSGDGVLIGSLFGVAQHDAAEGEAGVMTTTGVFEMPKLSTAVIAAGGKVSWDDSNARCDAPGTGKYPIGVAIEAAGNGAATVKVRLDGIATAAAA